MTWPVHEKTHGETLLSRAMAIFSKPLGKKLLLSGFAVAAIWYLYQRLEHPKSVQDTIPSTKAVAPVHESRGQSIAEQGSDSNNNLQGNISSDGGLPVSSNSEQSSTINTSDASSESPTQDAMNIKISQETEKLWSRATTIIPIASVFLIGIGYYMTKDDPAKKNSNLRKWIRRLGMALSGISLLIMSTKKIELSQSFCMIVPLSLGLVYLRFSSKSELPPTPSVPTPSIKYLLGLRFTDSDRRNVIKPDEIDLPVPLVLSDEEKALADRIRGSMIGLAIGDALGASVEFRPYAYLSDNPVSDFTEGGTWGLPKGYFTDDTSMALCLACSLICNHDFCAYDQFVRYKWWYRHGYMSATGECFDIGASTRQAVASFEKKQQDEIRESMISPDDIDYIHENHQGRNFNCRLGATDAAGNGSLMRLAPIPLFFHGNPREAVRLAGESSLTTHGDLRAIDACRFFAALIVEALHGRSKQDLLSGHFYDEHREWFADRELVPEILAIAKGSYRNKPNGYADGIRGAGYVVASLEAALWAFQNDDDSFERGALLAVNMGDDTDTTAAIYGQLAGAHYGYEHLPKRWRDQLYGRKFIVSISDLLLKHHNEENM